MGTEIERKFLVATQSWRDDVRESAALAQGYMQSPDAALRIRVRDDAGIFTIKGKTVGVTRGEWEWPIPVADARDLLEQFCGGRTLEKTRHHVDVGDHEWVVDEFHGDLEGLVVAEIELDSEDEAFEIPSWAGAEVSDDPRYFNINLVRDGAPQD